MTEDQSITRWFGDNLAQVLSEKITLLYDDFDEEGYTEEIKEKCKDMGYTQRIELHADMLWKYLPSSYPYAVDLLVRCLGEENKNETGMFTEFYWVMPIGKYIEKYGLDHFDISMKAIEEVTKRNTGEYAIRSYLRKYPEQTISIMQDWALSPNFHLRRLASEGSRPKLPWSTKLDVFIDNPAPVFKIIKSLIEDEVRFVQKSVANNLTDYLKVNKPAAVEFVQQFMDSPNKNTQWILKHATRKITI